MSVDVGQLPPSFSKYEGKESYFEGEAPLSIGVGYFIVIGLGVFFSLFANIMVKLESKFGPKSLMTSEYFNTAGRMVKPGLIASIITSQWTWAATLLQSSNVAWQYGVSGPFWYASGATIQVLLFGVLAVRIKKVAPTAHTVAEIVNARWGKAAHLTFLFFLITCNIIVSCMLLLGGAATAEALTGIDYILALFLIPWGIVTCPLFGGLHATYIAGYVQTVIIFIILVAMIFIVYIKDSSSDEIYEYLTINANKTPEQCAAIFSDPFRSFYDKDTYACGPVDGNKDGSYLTMFSGGGLMFGLINIVGNFGTVFVDQSYWQVAISAHPEAAAKGFFWGGLCWFVIPFSLATSLGLTSLAYMLPITREEAGAGLVPAAVATELLGQYGSVWILVMVFIAIFSTGCSESIAVSTLITYDVYRQYINPDAMGVDILFVSRVMIVVFGVLLSICSIILYKLGLNLGWVYLFMGIVIGSAVIPLWNLVSWKGASGTGAVVAAWVGLALAITSWLTTAKVQSGVINVATLGTNEAMLCGNLVSILSSGLIHWLWSIFIDPQDYDLSKIDEKLTLVEKDKRGLSSAEKDPELIAKYEDWIKRRSFGMTFVLVIVWPLLALPAGIFSRGYFAFWVFVCIAWAFTAAFFVLVYPITESSEYLLLLWTKFYSNIKSSRHREELQASPTSSSPQTNVSTNLA